MMIHSQLEENTLEVSCNRSSSAHNGLGQSSAWYCVMVLVMVDQQLLSFALDHCQLELVEQGQLWTIFKHEYQ